MKRKIIGLSSNTNVVSLPSDFCKKYNLSKGDELEVEEKDNILMISTDKELGDSCIEVDLSGKEPMCKRILGALFKTGYDEISVSYSSSDEKKAIEDVIEKEFIGFEIISTTETKITAKKLSEDKIDEFDSVLKRLFHVIKFIGKDSLETIEKQDFEKINELIQKDNEVNKLADFCRRILNKKGYSKFKRTPPLYYISEQLEKIGDEYRDLLKYVISHEIKHLDIETNRLFSRVNDYFDMIYDCFFAFDLKKISDIGKIHVLLKEDINKRIKENLNNAGVLLFLRDILEKSFDLNGAIMAASF
jgi:phosphate uptake regulator